MACNCRRMIDEPAGHEPTCDYGRHEYWVNLEAVETSWLFAVQVVAAEIQEAQTDEG